MDTVARAEFFAEPEVHAVLKDAREAIRRGLPARSFAVLEDAALAIPNEVMRTLLEEELQTVANDFSERLLINGEQHQPGTGKHCLGGPLEIVRHTYRPVGDGKTVVPLELVAGSRGGSDPRAGVQRRARLRRARHASACGVAARIAPDPPPRATLERMAKRLVLEDESGSASDFGVAAGVGERAAPLLRRRFIDVIRRPQGWNDPPPIARGRCGAGSST